MTAVVPAAEPKPSDPLVDGRFAWKASAPLVLPNPQGSDPETSIKDPSVVRYGDRWHVFCTVRFASGRVDMEYFNFADWDHAQQAPRQVLNFHDQYNCAPQVFYFRPQRRWYLIYQMAEPNHTPPFGPVYATTTELSDPRSWSKPQWLCRPGMEQRKWIDFWVICDAQKAHLFFTTPDGRLWRCDTPRADFPAGWSTPQVMLQTDIFEAAHVYRLKGPEQYLAIIEAQGDRRRYYKAYIAERLEGPWRGLADRIDKPFAGMANVTPAPAWTASVSHGELLRTGVDETLEVDPANLRFLIQGVKDQEYRGVPYGKIPWRLGILEAVRN